MEEFIHDVDFYQDELYIKKEIKELRQSARTREINKRSKLDQNDGSIIDQHDQFYRDHKLLLKLFQVLLNRVYNKSHVFFKSPPSSLHIFWYLQRFSCVSQHVLLLFHNSLNDFPPFLCVNYHQRTSKSKNVGFWEKRRFHSKPLGETLSIFSLLALWLPHTPLVIEKVAALLTSTL